MKYPEDFINKIILGDCLEVMPEIPDNSIDLIITDPPYGIEYSSNGGPRVSKNRKERIKKETTLIGDTYVDPKWFTESYRVLKSKSAAYFFCNFKSYSQFKDLLFSAGFTIKTTIVWDKGNCGMGDLRGDYGNQIELIIFCTKGRHILQGGRDRNILRYMRPADSNRLHPTQKPTELLSFLIKKSSQEESIILDPFSGSGSTSIACMDTNRRFIGIEKEEKYWRIANDRLLDNQHLISV